MKIGSFAALALSFAFSQGPLSGAQHSSADLVGYWGATVEVDKTKLKLVVKVTESTDGKISGKIDIPDQGAKDIPINALLFNDPETRWEIDAFDNIAFNGTLNSAGDAIVGQFDNGPGGSPLAVSFNRVSEAAFAQPRLLYTLGERETPDLRGYWLGTLNLPPENTRLLLKVGRAPDGTFRAFLDDLDRGSVDLPASSIEWTNKRAKVDWPGMRSTFEGSLDAAGNRLAGTWKQRGRTSQIDFKRQERAITGLPENLSYVPDPTNPKDVRGQWQGVLEIPNGKLRLILEVGKTPEGTFSGSLASPDQGGTKIPMSGADVKDSSVKFDWKGIGGSFKGTLDPGGTALDGTWEQMGTSFKLKLARAASTNAAKSQ